jgi:hypothetical protein
MSEGIHKSEGEIGRAVTCDRERLNFGRGRAASSVSCSNLDSTLLTYAAQANGWQ